MSNETTPKYLARLVTLSTAHTDAQKQAKQAEKAFQKHMEVRVNATRDVIRAVLAKKLGKDSSAVWWNEKIADELVGYLPADMRWALYRWDSMEPGVRGITLTRTETAESPNQIGGRIQTKEEKTATIPYDLLLLSDRDVAKRVRQGVYAKKALAKEVALAEAEKKAEAVRVANERRIRTLRAELAKLEASSAPTVAV